MPILVSSGASGHVKPLSVVGESIGFNYCDLISPQFVGSSLVRCLRKYIYPSLECQHKFENVYYLPVEKQKINNIRLEVLTLKGERVTVKSSKTPSRLVLHFLRIPVW